eukprot:scaffold66998_cov36-Phaeocystis_antarctica.AAC.1
MLYATYTRQVIRLACRPFDPTNLTNLSPRSTRRSSPRSPPLASVRARAGGPSLQQSCRLAPAAQRADRADCGARGGHRELEAVQGSCGKVPDARAAPGTRPGAPAHRGASDASGGASSGSFQALGIPDRALQALGRRVCEGAYPVWAGVPAAFAAGRGQSVDIWAKAKQPRGQGEARENVGRRDYFRRWTAVQRST